MVIAAIPAVVSPVSVFAGTTAGWTWRTVPPALLVLNLLVLEVLVLE